MDPIRVLYVNGGIMDRGGISSYMMNYYRHIDRSKVQIDFVVHGFEKGVFDDEIKELGGELYNIPIKSNDYFGNVKALREIFRSEKYKIVHSHMDAMGAIVLKEAKKCNIPVRIAHSHNTEHLTNNKVKYYLNELARKNITKYSTQLCACSELAGKWLFGEKLVENRKVRIINNAIDVNLYQFNEEKRTNIKKDLALKDNFIIGHIGRFDYQKNHMFLLEMFSQLIKEKPNVKLVLVGDGHLKNTIENKIEELKLSKHVILLGQRADVNDLMNIFDCFVLPSLFEGLPVVAIEAQANGLPCFLSSTITKEVALTDNIKFLNISNKDEWITSLSKSQILNREIVGSDFLKSGYEIESAAEKLCDLYLNLEKECSK